MSNYGYAPSGNPADWGATGTLTSNLRAYRPDPMTQHGWGWRMHGIVGKRLGGSAPTVTMAVYDSGDDLFERTDSFTVNTVMEDFTGGAEYTENLHSCIKMRQGGVYPQALLATVAALGHGMIAAAKINADDEKFYTRNVSSQPPPDPMGWTNSSTEGHIAVWTEYEPNVPPDIPDSGFEPDPGETGVATQPVFEAFFRDDNEIVGPFGLGEADTMSQFQIQIGPGFTGSSVDFDSQWVNATTTEKNDRKFNYQYNGPALSGQNRWRCRVKDDFGAASGYSDWIPFTVGGGSVTIPTPDPSGKQLTRQPSPFRFRWNHTGGLSTNAVQVRIKQGSSVIRTSGTIASVLAPGANGSVAWVSTGFDDLPVGLGTVVGASYSVRGRDSAGNWSDYSPDSPFTVDAAPSVPSQLWPDGQTVNELPELLCYVTDADDVAGSLNVQAEVLDESGTELFQRTMTHQGNNWFAYQIVPADGLVSGNEYSWKSFAGDGTFFSGGGSGSAVRSPQAPFDYFAGVTPQLVFPIGNQEVNTTRPVYDWSFAGTQVKFRVYVWNPVTMAEVYDSGIRTQSASFHTQPANYLSNDKRNRWQVTVWDTLNIPTTSSPEDFSVELDDVPQISFIEVGLHTVSQDDVATSVKISFGQTTYDQSNFKRYIINRRFARDTIFDVDDPFGEKVHRIAEITDPAETAFIDHPPFGVTIFYSVRQEVEVNGATYEGESISAETRLDFDGVVICDAAHCADKRAIFRGREDRTISHVREAKWVAGWGERLPTRFRTNFWGREVDTEYVLYSEDPEVIEHTLLDLDRMDIDGGPLIYRDGRGKYLFGEIDDYDEIDPSGGLLRRVQLLFKQSAARLTGAT